MIHLLLWSFWISVFGFGQLWSQSCDYAMTTMIVRGTSMNGLFASGDTIRVAEGFFNCNAIDRNDIVLVKWTGNEAPLLKRVVGLPGDQVRLEPNHGRSNLLIGGEILRTADGTPYRFDQNASRMLRVYIDSYRGVIPKAAFIVLGNLPEGSKDSSHFGWVGRNMLIAKVIEEI